MTEYNAASSHSIVPSCDLAEVRQAARRAAAGESAADRLRRLEERLRQVVELAEPLRDVVLVREREPERPIVLGQERLQQLAGLVAAVHALHEHHRFHRHVVEDGPSAAPGWDSVHEPLAAWCRRHALPSWQDGHHSVRLQPPGLSARYEEAIAAALPALQRFDTIEALRAHYYDDRDHSGGTFSNEPEASTVEAWVDAARRTVAGGEELLPQHIAEAAFWRRACALDPTLPARDLWPEDTTGRGNESGALAANRLLEA